MTASLTWLDHDEEARERVHRVMALFKERDTRDELGVGVIRDLVADDLFPGTSTIQTRLRYMLFIPWIYRRLEMDGCPSAHFGRKVREMEINLVEALLDSGDKAGIFGRVAGDGLERLPSSVYWAGLKTWGIRRFDASQEQYYSLIDKIRTQRENHRRTEEHGIGRGEVADAAGQFGAITWHPKLPEPPEEFPHAASIRLTQEESQFLQDQVATVQRRSLLATLVFMKPAEIEYPWEHPQLARFDPDQRTLLHHARLLSELMYGAALLYNLMLAELDDRRKLVAEHREKATEWREQLDHASLATWSLDWVDPLAISQQQVVSPQTKEFCRRWLEVVRASQGDVFNDEGVRGLVKAREMRLKGPRSRFTNLRAREQWSGYAGLFYMNYRWPNVQRFLADLHFGLQEADHT